MSVYRIFRTRSSSGQDIIVGMDRQGRRLASLPVARAPSITFYGRSTLEERVKLLDEYRRSRKE